MSKEYNKKTAVVEDRHVRFIEDENINFSALIRDLLDKYMEHKQQADDFQLNSDITNDE